MNIDEKFELALPRPNALTVVLGASAGSSTMLDFTARLAAHGQIFILDCGNRSNMYHVAKELRFLTNDPVAKLKNIRLSRAFTCCQVLSLLEKFTPNQYVPVLIFDLLSTFLDESVRTEESTFLFEKTLDRISSINCVSPIVVSIKPLLSISNTRMNLLMMLKERATQIIEVPTASPARSLTFQPSLLDGSWR